MRYDIGMNVFGDWKIQSELGEGSFGKVYRLEKNTYRVKAESALKVLTVPRTPGEIQDAYAEGYDETSITEQFHEVVEKLVDEIAVMAELKSHPNIVSIEDYTVVEHTNSIGWDILIRMELLTPLQSYSQKQPMDEIAVRKLATDICQALEFCHAKRLIHRDIKPANVFVDSLGQYKLGDFGVARTAEKTISNMSKQGTETYMAPEVYYGRAYGSNVDLYSLGIMLYRLMNKNRLPFYPLPPAFPKHTDREQSMVRRLRGETLPKPCDASDAFASVILKACEADPAKRYGTAAAMLEDLRQLDHLWDDVNSFENKGGTLNGSYYNVEFEEEISFENKIAEEDSWDATEGTVGIFSGKTNKKSTSIHGTQASTDNQGTKTSGSNVLHGSQISQIPQAIDVEEEDEDATISVFGDKKATVKKSEEIKSAESKTVEKKIVEGKKTEEKTAGTSPSEAGSSTQKTTRSTPASKDFDKTSDISNLELSVRIYNALKRAGIVSIEDLCKLTLEDLRSVNSVGPAAREEILAAMSKKGLQLSTGKSQKQLWKENKCQLLAEYWKANWSRILREEEFVSFERGKSSRNKHYYAPNIPEKIYTEAIFHMTEVHTKRFGQTIVIQDNKLKAANKKDLVCVIDLSLECEPVCSRGILVTTEAIYLHLGGFGKENVHPVMIPYTDFYSGWVVEGGGLLKAKHPVLHWTSRRHGACRYDSVYGNFLNYEALLECLIEIYKKEK